MDDPLLFRIILSTTKEERKNFSKSMFLGDLSYRTDKEKKKLRAALNLTFVLSLIYLVLFFDFVISKNLQWWHIPAFIFALYCLFYARIVPYSDYYKYEYKSNILRKKGILREPFNHIDFYNDYMQYNGLNKKNVGFNGFKFKEQDDSFYLKFILSENSKSKLEGFFLLKYQDVENSGVNIETFRAFLCEKANASDE